MSLRERVTRAVFSPAFGKKLEKYTSLQFPVRYPFDARSN